MDLLAAARAMAGRLAGDNLGFCGVSTDSRTIAAGELFLALRGENFDGHHYVAAAQARGAVAAVVAADAAVGLHLLGLPLIEVAETRLALGALAADWRSRFTLPVIAVTGSNGKTTTKEMIAAILRRQYGDTVLATRGNLNNEIGLPLTLLGLAAGQRAAVIEMGMNQPGEIAYLTQIGAPTVAVVTNAQRAHLAGMGDMNQIAREKGSIFAGLGAGGVAVVNADDAYAGLWRRMAGRNPLLTFGIERGADVRAVVRQQGLTTLLSLWTPVGQAELKLAVPGRHNARNALAAAAACLAAGIPLAAVVAGLEGFAGLKGRLQRRQGRAGAVVLDDTYNANPDSVRAGIDVLAATIGRKVLVLGDMGEIGEASGQYHDEIGGYAKSQGVDRLLAFGDASQQAVRNFGEGARHFCDIEKLIAAVNKQLGPETTVLVKGSRFMKMERVADAIVGEEKN